MKTSTEKNGIHLSWCQFIVLLCIFIGVTVAVGLIIGLTESGCKCKEDITVTPEFKPYDYPILPQTMLPVHYDVSIQPYLDTGSPSTEFTFTGEVDVIVQCQAETYRIFLNLRNLTVYETSVSVRELGNYTSARRRGYSTRNHVDVHSTEYDLINEFYIINLWKKLKVGKKYGIYMQFIGWLKDDLRGFYRSKYTTKGGDVRWVASTQMAPADARQAFPCFDEPSLKATFQIHIIRPNKLISLSNMDIIYSENWGDEWMVDHYQSSVVMPTYTVAFAVCDFIYIENTTADGRIKMRAYSQTQLMEHTSYILDAHVAMVPYLEEYFGIEYPMNKLYVVGIPEFRFGAMENYGLVVYNEKTKLTYDPTAKLARDQKRSLYTMAHEVAHQWFGNWVTHSWWDHVWMKEGFATFLGHMAADFFEPTLNMWDMFILDELHRALEFDSSPFLSHSVVLNVHTNEEINTVYDTIAYAKGGSIVRMTQQILGEEQLQRCMIKFLNTFKQGSANTSQIWEAFQEQLVADNVNMNIGDVMDTWTLQAGYPLVSVIRNYESDEISISQEHFLSESGTVNETSPYNYTWQVPVSLRWNPDDPLDVKIKWLHKTNDIVSLGGLTADQWLLVNDKAEGYYRVVYDDTNMNLLIQQLKTDLAKFDARNRAQIMDDAFMISRAGLQNYITALRTTEYLVFETDYLPWNTAMKSFIYLDRMLWSRDSLYTMYQEYMRYLANLYYQQQNWNGISLKEEMLTSMKREDAVSIACYYKMTDCTERASAEYKLWMEDTAKNVININLRQTAFCSALVEADTHEWEFAWKQYNDTLDTMLALGMACSHDEIILNSYLRRALDENTVSKQDEAISIFYYVSTRSLLGRNIVWKKVQTEFDDVLERLGTRGMSDTILATTFSFNTNEELAQLEHQLNTTVGGDDFKGTWEAAILNTKKNLEFMDKNEEDIANWLISIVLETRSRIEESFLRTLG